MDRPHLQLCRRLRSDLSRLRQLLRDRDRPSHGVRHGRSPKRQDGVAPPARSRRAVHRPTEAKEYTDRNRKKRSKTKWTGKIGINIEPLRDLLRIRGKERVFIASMGDLFHKDVPKAVQFAVLAVRVKPNLTLQLVTKRVDVMLERLQELDACAIAGAEGCEAYLQRGRSAAHRGQGWCAARGLRRGRPGGSAVRRQPDGALPPSKRAPDRVGGAPEGARRTRSAAAEVPCGRPRDQRRANARRS